MNKKYKIIIIELSQFQNPTNPNDILRNKKKTITRCKLWILILTLYNIRHKNGLVGF